MEPLYSITLKCCFTMLFSTPKRQQYLINKNSILIGVEQHPLTIAVLDSCFVIYGDTICKPKEDSKKKNGDAIYIKQRSHSIFQDYSLFLLIQCFKITICFFCFNISRPFLSHTHTTFCIFIHPLHFYSFIYTCLQPFITSHLKHTQTKNNVIYLQPFNNTYITPTMSYHLILTCMNRL